MVTMIAFILCLLTPTAFGQYRHVYQDTIYIGSGWSEAGNSAAQEKYSDLPWWERQEAYYKWQFENSFEEWLDENLWALKLRLQRFGNWPPDCDCCPCPSVIPPRQVSSARCYSLTGSISAHISNPYWQQLDYADWSQHFDTLILRFKTAKDTCYMEIFWYGYWEVFIGRLIAVVPQSLYELRDYQWPPLCPANDLQSYCLTYRLYPDERFTQ